MNMQVSAPAAGLPVPPPVHLDDTDEAIIRLIKAYQDGCKAYNELSEDEEGDEFAEQTYDVAWRELIERTPIIVSARGAASALRFCFHEGSKHLEPIAATAMIEAVLRFLESAAGAALAHPDAELLALADQLQGVRDQRNTIIAELEKSEDEWQRLARDRTGLEVRPGDWMSSLNRYIETNRRTFSPCMLAAADVLDTSKCNWFTQEQLERRNARLLELKEVVASHQKAIADFEQSSGRTALDEQDEALYYQQEDLKKAILALPARSLAGLAIKANIIKAEYPGFWWADKECELEVTGKEIRPLIDDILALAGDAQ